MIVDVWKNRHGLHLCLFDKFIIVMNPHAIMVVKKHKKLGWGYFFDVCDIHPDRMRELNHHVDYIAERGFGSW